MNFSLHTVNNFFNIRKKIYTLCLMDLKPYRVTQKFVRVHQERNVNSRAIGFFPIGCTQRNFCFQTDCDLQKEHIFVHPDKKISG
mgnify:CR=1 FL=1